MDDVDDLWSFQFLFPQIIVLQSRSTLGGDRMHDQGGMGSKYQGPENLSRGGLPARKAVEFSKEGFQTLGVCGREEGDLPAAAIVIVLALLLIFPPLTTWLPSLVQPGMMH
jgi:hypothetical protein